MISRLARISHSEILEIANVQPHLPTESDMSATSNTRRTRQDKQTVRIPFRTVSECEGLLVAYTACSMLNLPTPDCNR